MIEDGASQTAPTTRLPIVLNREMAGIRRLTKLKRDDKLFVAASNVDVKEVSGGIGLVVFTNPPKILHTVEVEFVATFL